MVRDLVTSHPTKTWWLASLSSQWPCFPEAELEALSQDFRCIPGANSPPCHTFLSATLLTSPLQYDHRTWTIGSARTPSLSRLIHLHTWVGAQDLAKEADKSVEVCVEAIANLDSASESRQLHPASFFFAPAYTLGFSKSGSSLHLPKLTWNQWANFCAAYSLLFPKFLN